MLCIMSNHKNILKTQLLSQANIDFIVNTIRREIILSDKSLSKCSNIITGYLSKYIDNVDKYPQNNDELLDRNQLSKSKMF